MNLMKLIIHVLIFFKYVTISHVIYSVSGFKIIIVAQYTRTDIFDSIIGIYNAAISVRRVMQSLHTCVYNAECRQFYSYTLVCIGL